MSSLFVAALTQLPKSARKVSGGPFEYIPAIVLGPGAGVGVGDLMLL